MGSDERRLSRRHLFRAWGDNVRQGISELVASRLPGAFEDEPPAVRHLREQDLAPPDDETVARLTRVLDLDQRPAAED